MRSILFFLFLLPAFAGAQTYKIETVMYDDTYYQLPGTFIVTEETVTVSMGRTATVYHLNAPVPTSEGQAFLTTSGDDSYMVLVKDLSGAQKGQTVLAIYSPVTEKTKMYFARKVRK